MNQSGIKLKLLIFISVWLLGGSSYAQIAIKGGVTDETGETLPGVTIEAQQTPVAKAITDNNGKYAINVKSANTVLVFRYIGYKPYAVNPNGKTTLNVKMTVEATKLNEVLVTGAMGLQREFGAVTYSSQSVDLKSINENRDLNIANTLSGKVAGIQVTTTGQPGSSSRIILRGESSISGNNQPLWVLDGIPIENSMGETENLDYGNGAADLNPNDIESIEVLKGANAAALYGSRAANGAILVTTKKAKMGDKSFGISFNQNSQVYAISEFPAYQNVYGEGTLTRVVATPTDVTSNGAINMGTRDRSWGAPMLGQPFNDYAGNPHGYNPQPNNIKDFYNTSLTNVSNIVLSKADALSALRVSYTYTDGNDVIRNQNLKTKHNLNLNASRKFNDKLSISTRIAYVQEKTRNRTPRNLSKNSPMAAYVFMTRSTDVAAFTPWKDADGNAFPNINSSSGGNPFWSIYEDENEDKHNRVIGAVVLNGEVFKNMKFRGSISGDLDFGKSYIYREMGATGVDLDGYYRLAGFESQNWNYEGLFMYNKKISNNLKLTTNFGGNISNRNYSGNTSTIEALLVKDMPLLSNSNTYPSVYETIRRSQVQSLLATATLNFKDLLYLDVTGRNDWSSMLPKSNRSYFYPSFGSSFVFTELLKENKILSYGKLRASWAKVGNSGQPYQLYNGYSYNGLFLGNPILSLEQDLKNFDLKPEQKISMEVGTDLAFFDNRFKLSAGIYQDNTTNQILVSNTPVETGFVRRVLNAGEIRNRGIEITSTATVIKKKSLSWDLNINWSKNISKVVSLAEGVPNRNLGGGVIVSASSYAIEGQPYGMIMGTGPYLVGDKVIVNASGRVYAENNLLIGSYRPDWIGSVGSRFNYKGFDLSALVTLKWGGLLYSATYARGNYNGNTIESLNPMFGRDAYLFGRGILGENGNEVQGIGLTVGTTPHAYEDSARPKGGQYPNSYYYKTENGSIVYDANGRIVPGERNVTWINPELLAADMILFNAPAVTFDATSIKVSELTFGYTIPKKMLTNVANGFIKEIRVALVARNPFILYKKTPAGIDPESAFTTGNQQGIENGGSFPYRQYGIDFKISF